MQRTVKFGAVSDDKSDQVGRVEGASIVRGTVRGTVQGIFHPAQNRVRRPWDVVPMRGRTKGSGKVGPKWACTRCRNRAATALMSVSDLAL